MNSGIEQFVTLLPEDWPEDKQLAVKPGDLSQFAPMGNGIGVPLVNFEWAPQSSLESRIPYYSFHPHKGHPFSDAPLAEPAGGTVYFDEYCKTEDLESVLRVLQVNTRIKAYAAFCRHAQDPIKERYLTQLRVVSKYGLRGMYRALSNEEFEQFPEQNLTIGELICRFVEFQKEKLGGLVRGSPLAGVMGGDGYWAYEGLAFGFMVENAYHSVYRLWTRAGL